MRRGNQRPTFQTDVSYAFSYGDDVVRMFKETGITFYESQEYEILLFMARKEDGSFACRTICISKPRQNGKSFGARYYAVEMAGEGKHVLYSAHHGATTTDMFSAILDIFRADEELHALLGENESGVYKSAGREKLLLTNGGEIRFQTRTSSGGRGGTFDIIVIDEAQELTESQLAAIKPTTIASESGDPQIIMLGTPPDDSCTGDVFEGLHKKAHANPSGCGFWWLEWAASELPNMADVESVLETAYETNPAMGYRIHEDVMLDAIRTATSVTTFAREHLGWWTNNVVSAVINSDKWDACATEEPPADGILAYAVKFSPDGARGTLSVCLKPKDGAPHVEVVDSRQMGHGISWFADWLEARKSKAATMVIDGMSNAQPLVDELVRRGVPQKAICKPRAADVASACSMLLNAVNERNVTHYAQPTLTESATKSKKRNIGGNGGWGFADNGCDSTLIESCALAYWGAMTTKRNPNRKQRFGF